MRVLNPVLRRELTERWRGRRAFWFVTVYVLVLAFILQLLYVVGRDRIGAFGGFGGGFGGGVMMDCFPGGRCAPPFFDGGGGASSITAGPMLGRFLFENLAAFILLLVLFIAPGYAAAQIAGERERHTLRLLQATMLRPFGIVVGKLGAAIAWLVLLVLAAVPFVAATFFLGGVNVSDLLRTFATILLVAVGVAGIGLGVSSVARRTVSAVVVTYGIVLVLTIGSAFGALVERSLNAGFDHQDALASLYVNPFYGLADASRADQTLSGYGDALPSVLGVFARALPGTEEDTFGGGFEPPIFIDPPMPMPGPIEDGEVVFVKPAAEGVGEVATRAEIAAAEDATKIEMERRAVVLDAAPHVAVAAQDLGAGPAPRKPVWLLVSGVYAAFGVGGLIIAMVRVHPDHAPSTIRVRRRRFRRRDATATVEEAVT